MALQKYFEEIFSKAINMFFHVRYHLKKNTWIGARPSQ